MVLNNCTHITHNILYLTASCGGYQQVMFGGRLKEFSKHQEALHRMEKIALSANTHDCVVKIELYIHVHRINKVVTRLSQGCQCTETTGLVTQAR